MTYEIQNISSLQPANFSIMKDNSSLQITLIVNLLSDSIKNQQPICKSDVINTYVEWKFTSKEGVYIEKDVKDPITGTWSYPYVKVDKEEYRSHWRTVTLAKQWFKSNLGAAIIKGRLLVIPIIDL